MALSDKVSNLITFLLVGYFLYSVFIQHNDVEQSYTSNESDTQEITNLTHLLNKTGQLTRAGWSRTGPDTFNSSLVYPVWFGLNFLREVRIKKWDYFSFTFGTKLVQVVVANVWYSAISFVSVFDFETNELTKFKEKLIHLVNKEPFPLLASDLRECPATNYVFRKGGYVVSINQTLDNATGTCAFHVSAEVEGKFSGNFTSERNMTEEQLFELIPISENHRYFFYSLKSLNNRCQGQFTLEGKQVQINNDTCVGIMDQARSVLHYKTSWIWASAGGRTTDGKVISFNLGTGLGHAKGVNVFFAFKVDGKIIAPRPGPITYDKSNLMAGVTFRTAAFYPSDSLWMDVTFTPQKENHVTENVIVAKSNLHYVYGTFAGRIVDATGKPTTFTGLRGLVEVAAMKW
jgi:hypothetical protein